MPTKQTAHSDYDVDMYTIHWFEEDPFNGKITHHWTNVVGLEKAKQAQRQKAKIYQKVKLDKTADLSWDPLSLTPTKHNNPPSYKLTGLVKGHHGRISDVNQLKAIVRAGAFAWPGGYEVFFVTSDGGYLCYDCVIDNFQSIMDSIKTRSSDGWRVEACSTTADVDEELACSNCDYTFGTYLT